MNIYNSRRCVAKYFGFLIMSSFLILSDQYTKYMAAIHLKDHPPYTLAKGILSFRYLENTGAAWGILGGKRILFAIFTVIIILVMIIAILKIEKEFYSLQDKSSAIVLQWVLAALISGALGNFIDRIRLGYVIDFIYFELIDFPVFNAADCYVVISTAILLFLLLFGIKDSDWNIILNLKKSGGGPVG